MALLPRALQAYLPVSHATHMSQSTCACSQNGSTELRQLALMHVEAQLRPSPGLGNLTIYV
jgi:hypothetical protein